MQWKKKKAVKPHEMGLYSSPQAIQTPYNYNIFIKYMIAFCGFSYS